MSAGMIPAFPDTQNKNEDQFADVRDYWGSGASCSRGVVPLSDAAFVSALIFFLLFFFPNLPVIAPLSPPPLSLGSHTQRCLPALCQITPAIVQLHRVGQHPAVSMETGFRGH